MSVSWELVWHHCHLLASIFSTSCAPRKVCLCQCILFFDVNSRLLNVFERLLRFMGSLITFKLMELKPTVYVFRETCAKTIRVNVSVRHVLMPKN